MWRIERIGDVVSFWTYDNAWLAIRQYEILRNRKIDSEEMAKINLGEDIVTTSKSGKVLIMYKMQIGVCMNCKNTNHIDRGNHICTYCSRKNCFK